jgi:hypothetical protein
METTMYETERDGSNTTTWLVIGQDDDYKMRVSIDPEEPRLLWTVQVINRNNGLVAETSGSSLDDLDGDELLRLDGLDPVETQMPALRRLWTEGAACLAHDSRGWLERTFVFGLPGAGRFGSVLC